MYFDRTGGTNTVGLLDDAVARMDPGDIETWFDGLKPELKREAEILLANAPRAAPQPGPQTMAYFSEADVTGYGGAAGGGKSALAAMLAVNEHHRTAIFRLDGKQVSQLVDDLVDFAGVGEVGLNRGWGVFRVPGDRKQVIEWGGIGKPGSEAVWRGRAHDLKVFDEAQELPEAKIRFLRAWNRSAVPGQRCRTLICFNPPGSPDDISGAGGRWLVTFFAPWLDPDYTGTPARPGEIRYFFKGEDGVEREVDSPEKRKLTLGDHTFMVAPESRTFIPALLKDNRYLADDGEYAKTLAAMEEPYRTMLMTGDFRLGVTDDEWQLFPTRWVEAAMRRWKPEGRFLPLSSVGCDVARGGLSESTTVERHQWWWSEINARPGRETPEGSDVANMCLNMWKPGARICIDGNGVGADAVSRLRQVNRDIVDVVMPQKEKGLPRVDELQRAQNLRVALSWRLRRILNPDNKLDAALPPDPKLKKQLLAPRYSRSGKYLQVESKDDVFKRTGERSDRMDCVLYSCLNADTTEGAEIISPYQSVKRPKDVPIAEPARRRTRDSWMGA